MWQRLGSQKMSWDFAVLCKVVRKWGRFMVSDSSGGRMDGCRLLDSNNVKKETHQPVRYGFCRGVMWQVAYHHLHGFFGFGVEHVIVQVISVEAGFDRFEIRHSSRDDSGSISSAMELKVF
jgi:hypothetical protein